MELNVGVQYSQAPHLKVDVWLTVCRSARRCRCRELHDTLTDTRIVWLTSDLFQALTPNAQSSIGYAVLRPDALSLLDQSERTAVVVTALPVTPDMFRRPLLRFQSMVVQTVLTTDTFTRLPPVDQARIAGLVAAPPPVYRSWDDFMTHTTPKERRAWCESKAKTANRNRLQSGKPQYQITADEVWGILEAAQGHCNYCGSLALERRPSGSSGAPLPWEHIGRRIGSLEHRKPLNSSDEDLVPLRRSGSLLAQSNKAWVIRGQLNNPSNLAWSCLWCNTWPILRIPGALDHGGLPKLDDLSESAANILTGGSSQPVP